MIPSPQVFAQGQTVLSGDAANTFVQGCTTAAQLRTVSGVSTMVICLFGIATINDGSGGFFYWDASATAPDDNLNTIVPYGITEGAWLRLTLSV